MKYLLVLGHMSSTMNFLVLAKYGQNANGIPKLTIDTDTGTLKADDLTIGSVSIGQDYVVVVDMDDQIKKITSWSDPDLVNKVAEVAAKLREEYIYYDKPEEPPTDW